MYRRFQITPQNSIVIGDKADRTVDFESDRHPTSTVEDWSEDILTQVTEDDELLGQKDLKESVQQKSREIYQENVDQSTSVMDAPFNYVSTYAFNLGKANGRAFNEVTEDFDETALNSIESYWVNGMHEGVQEALDENNVNVSRTGSRGSADFESAPVRAAEYLEKGFYSE